MHLLHVVLHHSRTPARLSYTFKMNRLVPNSVLIPSSLNTLKLLNYVTILENITKLDNESGVAYFSLLSFCCLRSYHREYTGSCLKLSSVGRGSYLDGWPPENTPCSKLSFPIFSHPFLKHINHLFAPYEKKKEMLILILWQDTLF